MQTQRLARPERSAWNRFGVRAALVCGLAGLTAAAGAQTLWQDHNPYRPNPNVRNGTILRLAVDEPVIIEYEYENLSDDTVTIKMNPDQKLTDFLQPADINKAVTEKDDNRVRVRSRVTFRMAVRVDRDPRDDSVSFSGVKLIAAEAGRSRQQIQISGSVHIDDIKPGRLVNSSDVADLQIVVQGAPIRQSLELPLKQVEGEVPGTTEPSAELSAEERARILLEYLNRVLGASRDAR